MLENIIKTLASVVSWPIALFDFAKNFKLSPQAENIVPSDNVVAPENPMETTKTKSDITSQILKGPSKDPKQFRDYNLRNLYGGKSSTLFRGKKASKAR